MCNGKLQKKLYMIVRERISYILTRARLAYYI